MASRASAGLGRFAGRLVVAVAVVVVLLLALTVLPGAIGDRFRDGLSSLNPFQEEQTDRTGPSVLYSLQELEELTAASGHYEVVVDLEEGTSYVPDFLSGQRVLYVGKGDVDVVVDFAELDESRIEVSEDRTSATIDLPAPQIQEADLDVEDSYFAESDGGLFDGSTSDLEREAQLEAIEKIDEAANDEGQLIDLAEKSTVSTLRGLLTALGFTDITITFDGEAPEETAPAE